MDAWQIKLDCRTLSHLTVNLNMTAGLFGEAVDLRQAQSRAVADIFGGEEWIEGLGLHLRRHTAPSVSNCDHDILAGHNLHLRSGIVLIEVNVGSFQGKFAATRHRVARVHG